MFCSFVERHKPIRFPCSTLSIEPDPRGELSYGKVVIVFTRLACKSGFLVSPRMCRTKCHSFKPLNYLLGCTRKAKYNIKYTSNYSTKIHELFIWEFPPGVVNNEKLNNERLLIITSNNQRSVKCVRSLVKVSFIIYFEVSMKTSVISSDT